MIPDTPAVTLTLTGLPAACPNCQVPADQVTEWLLGTHGHLFSVICPRCFTAVAPIRAVAAPPPSHYHDATGYEDTPCTCPSPLTYAPQWAKGGTEDEGVPMVCTGCRKPVERSLDEDRWVHVSVDDGLDCSAVNWGPVKAMVAAGNENVP